MSASTMSHIGSMSSSARGGHIFHLPLSPILVLHIVSQHNTSNPTVGWKPVFKYIAFDLACDRTNNESRCLPIVFFCRQNKWRPPPRLFKPRFWGEVHPDDIPASWDVCLLLSYHSSEATGFVSNLETSGKLSGEICFSMAWISTFNMFCGFTTGRRMIDRSGVTSRSTKSPKRDPQFSE